MLTFSQTQVQEFHRSLYNPALRWGQAFHQYFKLEKIKGADKDWCDKLYYADTQTAKSMVKERTDCTQ